MTGMTGHDWTHNFQKQPEPAIQVIRFVQRYIKVIKLCMTEQAGITT